MGEVIDLGRRLNVASVVLLIVGTVGELYGLQELFLLAPLDEMLLGMTASEIGVIGQNLLDHMKLESQLKGLYVLSTALIFCVIFLIPFRRGKWAWYTALIVGGLMCPGKLFLSKLALQEVFLIYTYFHLP